MSKQRNIEKVFHPMVQATEKSGSQITSEIKNLKKQETQPPVKISYRVFQQLFSSIGSKKIRQVLQHLQKNMVSL